MSESLTPAPEHDPALVARRHLLRGGAVLAGAAGVAVVGAVAAAPTASASADYLELGGDNGWPSTTTLEGGGPDGIADPALRLENHDGPSLSLEALATSWTGTLALGDILNTTEGPLVGVDYGDGVVNDALVTNHYLSQLPVTIPISPFRVLDTRQPPQPTIVATSPDALDTQGRLKAGAWIDVGFAERSENFTLVALFVNVTVPQPTANGHLIIYPGGSSRPNASSLSYQTGKSTSNAAFVGCGLVGDVFAVRVWVSKTTHLVLDISGASLTSVPSTVTPPPPPVAPARVGHQPAQVKAAEAVRRALS